MTLKNSKTKLYESKEGQLQEKKDEAVLEEEVNKLEKELVEEKKALGKEKEAESKEKLKEIYQSELKKEKEAEQEKEDFKKEQPGTGTAATPTKTQKQVSDDASKIKKMDQKNQVKALVKLVFAKNLAYAIKVARNLDSPYVLDEFHDTLVDEHYEEMVEEKKLKKI